MARSQNLSSLADGALPAGINRNPIVREQTEAPSLASWINVLMMTCVKGRSVTNTRSLVYLLPKPKVIYGIQQIFFFFSQRICISTNFHGLGAFAMERRTLHYFSHSFSGESEAEVALVTIPNVVGWLPKKGENRLLLSCVHSIEHVRTIKKRQVLSPSHCLKTGRKHVLPFWKNTRQTEEPEGWIF